MHELIGFAEFVIIVIAVIWLIKFFFGKVR